MAKHGDITTGLAAASDRLTTFRQVEDEQKRLVLAAVKQGALLAYGYQAPRRLEDQPVAVPLALWRQVVRWNTNEIEGEGLKIIGVRLISLRTVQSLCNDSPPAQDRGRPTREPEILAAYDTLIRSGIVKPDDTVKTKAAAIRAHVKSQHAGPDSRTDGLSDEAIRRALKSHPQSTKS